MLSRARCSRAWCLLSRAQQARIRALYMAELRHLDRWCPDNPALWQHTYQRLLDLKATSGLGIAREEGSC